MLSLSYIVLGLAAGIFSGLVGLGGGIIVVPALVMLFGFSQHEAQGTTLALMVPPIGILAAWTYYREGWVNIPVAAWICLGFLVGGLIGAKLSVGINEDLMKKIFGGFLILIALKLMLTK